MLQGCDQPAPSERTAVPSASPSASPPPPVASSAPARGFVFPSVAIAAKPGDFVLAPSSATLQGIARDGLARHTVIYYGGWLREPGRSESLVEALAGHPRPIPNAAIIPVAPGQRAEPGDMVLTSWASGSGMQRAITVEGGTPEAPVVRYLDMELENPSGWGKKPDRLRPNTFAVLGKRGEPGTTAACPEGDHSVRYIVTRRLDARILALAFAGKLRVVDAASCEFLELRPELKRKRRVLVPYLGRFVESEVVRTESEIGRVVVQRKVGGKRIEQAVPLLDVKPMD